MIWATVRNHRIVAQTLGNIMAKKTITPIEREWLKLNAKALKAERELHALRDNLRSMKPQILDCFGYRGARDELLTALIMAKK